MADDIYLTLGCYGRAENDFILCPSINNKILKIDHSLTNLDDIINYLDSIKLFDRPLLDNNAIKHLIYNLQDRFDQKFKRIWSDHQYNLLERFMIMHKPCGLYSQLIIIDSEQDSNIDLLSLNNKDEIYYKKAYTPNIRGRKFQ